MITAHDAANFFLSPVVAEEGEITNLKLQKLLYYAQGYALAILGRPLFEDKIENWKHGPVVKSVYHTYKQYRAQLLPVTPAKLAYDDEDLYILCRVHQEKGQYAAWALREQTHQESPWLNTRNGEEITLSALHEYFAYVMPPNDFNFDLERMKERLQGNFVRVPAFGNVDDLVAWMEQ